MLHFLLLQLSLGFLFLAFMAAWRRDGLAFLVSWRLRIFKFQSTEPASLVEISACDPPFLSPDQEIAFLDPAEGL